MSLLIACILKREIERIKCRRDCGIIAQSGQSSRLKLHRSWRVSIQERPMDGGMPEVPAIPLSPTATIELFEQAVATHSRRLLGIARAIVGTRTSPEDVVQQALVNLFEHRQHY